MNKRRVLLVLLVRLTGDKVESQSREVLWVCLIKNSSGRRGIIWLTGYAPASREVGAGTQHRDPREKLKKSPGGTLLTGSLSFASYVTQALLTVDQALSQPSPIKKTPST